MDFITLPSATALGLPFSSAVLAGDFLYLSGARSATSPAR